MSEIGDALDALMRTVEARKGDAPEKSYTASLLAAGPARCAKKLGEEAVEVALAGVLGDRDELTAEAADLLYHLAVLLAANDVSFAEVAGVLEARRGVSGHAEKASR